MMYLLVFVAMVLADICWAYYFISIEKRNSLAAGMWGSIIYIFGAFTVTHYINDIKYLVPAVLGSFIGTALVIEYKKRKEKKENAKNINQAIT